MIRYSFQCLIREANEAIVPKDAFQPNSIPRFFLKLVVMFYYPDSQHLQLARRHVFELFAPCYKDKHWNATAWVPVMQFMEKMGMPENSVTDTFLRLVQCGCEMLALFELQEQERMVLPLEGFVVLTVAAGPNVTPTRLMRLLEVEEEGGVCSVCLDDIVVGSMVGRVSCSHVFHEKCINKWLKNNRSCPNCRFCLG